MHVPAVISCVSMLFTYIHGFLGNKMSTLDLYDQDSFNVHDAFMKYASPFLYF